MTTEQRHTLTTPKVSRQVRRATERRLTKIQWTGRTWQVTAGCKEWSPGCLNCYARRDARRMGSNPNEKVRRRYEGLVVLDAKKKLRWSGEVRLLPEQIVLPLRWGQPETIFVNSLSDLFQKGVSFKFIAAVFGVMAMCRRHTFQVLTKRPNVMRLWMEWITEEAGDGNEVTYCNEAAKRAIIQHAENVEAARRILARHLPMTDLSWPLPNVWMGTSVEDQQRANERIPDLIATPAALRFLSCEPLLEQIDLSKFLRTPPVGMARDHLSCTCGHAADYHWLAPGDDDSCSALECTCEAFRLPSIHWVIPGGESGPGARPNSIAWVRSLIKQCREAGVSAFVKQLGASVLGRDCEHGRDDNACRFVDRKGGDMAEWAEDLRVREMPRSAGLGSVQ